MLGSWFMMREVEAANARISDVTVKVHDGKPRVCWALPASKTDQRAVGVSRAHGCLCGASPRPSCPAHAAWAHITELKARFGELPADSPFFPDARGRTCTKEAMASTLVEAARFLDAPIESATGRITGHSMRVTGAQGMASAGLDLWAIQLLGRWGSMAVRTYVREAHLDQAELWAQKVAQQTDLSEMTKSLAKQVEVNMKDTEVWKALERKAAEVVKEAASNQRLQMPLEDCAEALAAEAIPVVSKSARLDVVTSSCGVVHQVAFGPPEAELALSMTTCGWRFGGAAGAKLSPRAELPPVYKRLCARCFPEEREEGKRTFAESAKVV